MTRSLNRRTLLRTALVLGVGATAVACSSHSPPPPAPSPSAPPGPTGSPAPTSSPGTRPRPAVERSFGPNGTHFPADVPWPGDTAPVELEAECSWPDIARQVQSLTAAQVEQGVVIRVAPGTLPGSGYGSSSRAVMSNVGNPEWTRNVLICPRDGFSTVTMSNEGVRFDQCARLSFFGFVSASGFVLTRCMSMQIGWSRFDAASVTRGGADIAFYELVIGFRQNADDTMGVRPTENFEMTRLSRYGCVFGPSVKPDGSDAHCDTIQLEGTGSGPFGPFTSEDCVDYGSSNAAELLSGGLSEAEYRHCMILGGQLPWQVYPLRPGDYAGEPNAFAGGCQNVRLFDSVVSGAIGRMGFTEVSNTRLSYSPQPSQQPSAAGSWNVDTGISGWGREEIMRRQAIPDYELTTLRQLWTW